MTPRANPFVALLDASGWMLAGDGWARIALLAADRARECWRRAGEATDAAERGCRELGAEATAERGEDWTCEPPKVGDERAA
jgi:hypothetical protein